MIINATSLGLNNNENIFKSTDESLPSESEARKFWEDLNHE